MRKLEDVLDQMVAVVPELEDKFYSVRDSIKYTAPEAIGDRWLQVMYILEAIMPDHPKEEEIKKIWTNR